VTAVGFVEVDVAAVAAPFAFDKPPPDEGEGSSEVVVVPTAAVVTFGFLRRVGEVGEDDDGKDVDAAEADTFVVMVILMIDSRFLVV